jgi:coproporphyrinogen III oxidase-like Fe-S oxidoreductase
MRAVDLGVENISIFRLHLYPDIRLNRMVESDEVPPLPGNDEARAMQERAVALLEGAGYRRQHPSGFVLPGKESRYHELYYKHQSEGLGLGVTNWFYSLLGNYNYINTDSLERYVQMIDDGLMPVDRIYAFSEEEMMKRYVLRSIRSGIDRRSFLKKFGIPLDEAFGNQICRLKEAGWIYEEKDEIKLTSSAHDEDGVGRCMDILTGTM